MGPRAAYALFLAITAVNPTTVVCFAAVLLGNQDLVTGLVPAVVIAGLALHTMLA